MNEFISSPVWGVVGLALTFIFGTLSIYQYLRSRRFKQLVFTYLPSTLQTRNHPDISILFKGKEINNVSKLVLLCWNSGTEEIRTLDIPTEEPSEIIFTGAKILSYKLLEQSSSVLNFKAKQISDQTLAISFEYLNPKDGGLFEILYESQSDAVEVKSNIQIIGGRQTSIQRYDKLFSDISVVVLPSITIPPFIGIAVYFTVRVNSIGDMLGAVFIILLTLFFIVMGYQNFKSYIASRVPKFAIKYFEGKL